MIVLVCQGCDEIIDVSEGEKVQVLYGKCEDCRHDAGKLTSDEAGPANRK